MTEPTARGKAWLTRVDGEHENLGLLLDVFAQFIEDLGGGGLSNGAGEAEVKDFPLGPPRLEEESNGFVGALHN